LPVASSTSFIPYKAEPAVSGMATMKTSSNFMADFGINEPFFGFLHLLPRLVKE
jgi:hypothetical protein